MNAKMNAEQFKKLKNLNGLKNRENGEKLVGSACETYATEQPENVNYEARNFTEDKYLGFKKTLWQINNDYSKELSDGETEERDETRLLEKERCDSSVLIGIPALSESDKLSERATQSLAEPTLECEKNEFPHQAERDKVVFNDLKIGNNAPIESETANFSVTPPYLNGDEVEKTGADDSEIENERYRSEFNEFRYERYMGFVVADMRRVYGAGKITAALSDFESEKPYAYAFTTRGLSSAGVYVKNARKALKKSQNVLKSAILANKNQTCGVKSARKKCVLPRACAVVGGDGSDCSLQITLKEISLAKKQGASEITVFVSPTVATAGSEKVIRSEIKALKRACFNKTFKLGVNLGELTPLQAESVILIGAALKIKAFTLYGDDAFFKLKSLKSLAPGARFELYSQVDSAKGLSELIRGGADKIYTSNLTQLSRSVRETFKSVKV